MKLNLNSKWMVAIAVASVLSGQVNAQFTNFIRQVQLPDNGVQRDVTVPASGQVESPLEINPFGARFELHTVRTTPLTSYLLDSRYVGSYVPLGNIAIRTEDVNAPVYRTRADRPFYVDVVVSGLRAGAGDPEASKSVNLLHHTQSYGVGGDGSNIDRTQAILSSQVNVKQNGTQTLTYALTTIAGADRSKIRGEERFSIYSLADFQAPASQLASQTVQIWPVADGTISGIADGETIEFSTPTLTLAINDIYPDARVYAQIYKGEKRDDGFVGEVLPGSAVAVNESVPQNRLLTVSEWDSVLTENGAWTIELLTFTPFGIDRLDYVTINVDRTITIIGTVTTSE
jgi:hypothetical protein